MEQQQMQKRRRCKQVQSLEERLADQANGLREQAELLPPGALREQVLLRPDKPKSAGTLVSGWGRERQSSWNAFLIPLRPRYQPSLPW